MAALDAPAAHRQAPCRTACRGRRAGRRLVARTADGGAEPLCRGRDRRGGAPSAAPAAAKNLLALADAADPERGSGLIVLGMGKLGGGELNYSSDIDLILLYDPAEARVAARDGPHAFFSRLARDLVRILDERTGDGYVFRTDLRLRPDPRSTPLGDVGRGGAHLLRKRRPELGARRADQGAPGGRRPRRRRALSARAAALYLAQKSRFRGDRTTSTRSSARSTRIAAAAGSRSRATTSRSAAAASARSSSSPRPSS